MREALFGLDNFESAKYSNETETIANSILNLLFGKPGYFPSMPELGINIQQYLYSFWDEVDTDFLKAKIISQCSTFREFVNDGTLDVIKSSYKKKPLLLIVLPLVVKNTKENLAIGIRQDEHGTVSYNYQFVEETD